MTKRRKRGRPGLSVKRHRSEMCRDCMYCIPMLTPKGMTQVCLNPDSKYMYSYVSQAGSCDEFYRDEECEE